MIGLVTPLDIVCHWFWLEPSRQISQKLSFRQGRTVFCLQTDNEPLRKVFPVLCEVVVNLKKDSPTTVEQQSFSGSIYTQCATLHQQPDFTPSHVCFAHHPTLSSLPTPPLPLLEFSLLEHLLLIIQNDYPSKASTCRDICGVPKTTLCSLILSIPTDILHVQHEVRVSSSYLMTSKY